MIRSSMEQHYIVIVRLDRTIQWMEERLDSPIELGDQQGDIPFRDVSQ